MAAIESRIAALEGARAARGRPGAAHRRRSRPAGRRRRRPAPSAPARPRRSSTPTWPRSATSSGPPASRREAGSRRSTCRRRSSPSRPWSTPTRGPTSSSRWGRTRWPSRRATSPSRPSPAGFLTKVGKMRDAFGKVNGQHPHTLPFIDRPLVTRNLTGGEDGLADAGISVARLIPNPWLFLEATGQVYQGNSAIFKAPTRGRPRLRRPPARVPGPRRVDQHRPRRLDRVRPQRRSPRTPRRASSASTPRCAGSPCAARSTRTSSPAAR